MVQFRSIEDRGPLVLITHPREALLATGPAHIVKTRDEVCVRVWANAPVEAVRFAVDAEPWNTLWQGSDNLWRAALSGDRLGKGTHRLAVHAEAGGDEGEAVIDFAVDSTGRYTAVPMVRPVVLATNFC